MESLRVVIEDGKQKVFASAIDWPGWSRAGKKTPEAAITELLAYRERYAEVLEHTNGIRLTDGDVGIAIVEEQPGDGATDFGVPGKVAELECGPIEGDELERGIAVLQATWSFFDRVAATVSPTLQKGPRGGGRDRDQIVQHVLESEGGYARYLGIKRPVLAIDDAEAIVAHRAAIVDALRANGPRCRLPDSKWPVRYTIRRMAWHVLDHAWEMQDKDLTGKVTS